MDLKNKKVLVVGLGKSGLAAALFLRRRGAQVTVSDLRSAEQLAKEIPALIEAGIMVEAGGHGLLTFRRQDLIVVSPGVPLNTPELVQAKNFGLPVIGELELAARFLKGKTLAVTGSNGKTTTTSLLGEILSAAGLQTLVGGNITILSELCEKTRNDAFQMMMQHAAEHGANAIVSARYDANELMQGVTEVLAYGTAVWVEKI